MGFLSLTPDTPLDFNKVVISFWYRIPAATATAAVAEWIDLDRYDRNSGMLGVVPLLTFGPQQEDLRRDFEGPHDIDYAGCSGDFGACINSYHSSAGYTMLGTYSSFFTSPSFIGVKFWPDATLPSFSLNIQTDQYGSQSLGEYFLLTDFTVPACIDTCPDGVEVFTDTGFTEAEHHAAFGNGPWDSRNLGFTVSDPTDTWHHVVISWDVGTENIGTSASSDVTSDASLYITHDKINKTGSDLPGHIQASNTMDTIGPSTARGTYTQTIGTIPTSPLSIPGPLTVKMELGSDTTPVLKVEMAELQIYTGVSVDTATLVDAFVTTDGQPQTDFTIADTLLGKSPEVRIHGSTRWVAGTNLGTAGNFTPTGTISSYTTSPDLTP